MVLAEPELPDSVELEPAEAVAVDSLPDPVPDPVPDPEADPLPVAEASEPDDLVLVEPVWVRVLTISEPSEVTVVVMTPDLEPEPEPPIVVSPVVVTASPALLVKTLVKVETLPEPEPPRVVSPVVVTASPALLVKTLVKVETLPEPSAPDLEFLSSFPLPPPRVVVETALVMVEPSEVMVLKIVETVACFLG